MAREPVEVIYLGDKEVHLLRTITGDTTIITREQFDSLVVITSPPPVEYDLPELTKLMDYDPLDISDIRPQRRQACPPNVGKGRGKGRYNSGRW